MVFITSGHVALCPFRLRSQNVVHFVITIEETYKLSVKNLALADTHDRNQEFQCNLGLQSPKIAFLLPKLLSQLLLAIVIVKLAQFSRSRVQVYRIISNQKGHNFLILNLIFTIRIPLERYLSLLSNGISLTPKLHVNIKLWSKNRIGVWRH